MYDNYSSKVESEGYYFAKCKGTDIEYRKVHTTYMWFDNIDANSFIEAYKQGAFSSSFGSAIANIIESSWDMIGEKILSTDYSIIVKGKYDIKDGTIPMPKE